MHKYRTFKIEREHFINTYLLSKSHKLPLNHFIMKSEGHDDYTTHYWVPINDQKNKGADTGVLISEQLYATLYEQDLLTEIITDKFEYKQKERVKKRKDGHKDSGAFSIEDLTDISKLN